MNSIKRQLSNINGMSLRNKLFFIYSAFIITEFLFVFNFLPTIIENQSLKSAQILANGIAETTAYNISSALFFNDSLYINSVLKNSVKFKDITYILIENIDTQVVASINYYEARRCDYKKIVKEHDIFQDNITLKVSTPIIEQDELIGTLYLGLSLADIQKKANDTRTSIALVSLIMLVVGLVLVFSISNFLTKPLFKLKNAFLQIAEGDFSQRVEIRSRDEVASLANSFNSMVERLETAYNKLHEEIEIRKQTEEQLLLAQSDLSDALEHEKQLNELKTRFVSMVSHEYRTPLTIIQSSTYLLDIFFTDYDSERFQRQLDIIRDAVKNMTHMLDEVLIIGKSDAGKLMYDIKHVNIIPYISEVVQQAELIEKNGHKLIFNTYPEKCIVETDENLLMHILGNLISNAVKYSPPNTEIEISVIEVQNIVSISVKDHGIGIPENEMEHLFDTFYRASNIGNVAGTGLGLAIVKRYLDILNGTIDVTSEEEKGTTFTVSLNKVYDL
jgi:signal transduction histidine kinase